VGEFPAQRFFNFYFMWPQNKLIKVWKLKQDWFPAALIDQKSSLIKISLIFKKR